MKDGTLALELIHARGRVRTMARRDHYNRVKGSDGG